MTREEMVQSLPKQKYNNYTTGSKENLNSINSEVFVMNISGWKPYYSKCGWFKTCASNHFRGWHIISTSAYHWLQTKFTKWDLSFSYNTHTSVKSNSIVQEIWVL